MGYMIVCGNFDITPKPGQIPRPIVLIPTQVPVPVPVPLSVSELAEIIMCISFLEVKDFHQGTMASLWHFRQLNIVLFVIQVILKNMLLNKYSFDLNTSTQARFIYCQWLPSIDSWFSESVSFIRIERDTLPLLSLLIYYIQNDTSLWKVIMLKIVCGTQCCCRHKHASGGRFIEDNPPAYTPFSSRMSCSVLQHFVMPNGNSFTCLFAT